MRHGSGQPPAKHACKGNGDGRRPLRPRIARGSRQPYGLSLVPAGMRRLRGRRPQQRKRACLAGVCPSQRAHSGRAGWCPAAVRTRGRAVRAGWCLARRCALRFAGGHGATLLGSAHPATSLPARRWAHPPLRARTVPNGARRSPRSSSRYSGADASPADRQSHSGPAGATAGRPSLRRSTPTTTEPDTPPQEIAPTLRSPRPPHRIQHAPPRARHRHSGPTVRQKCQPQQSTPAPSPRPRRTT